MAYQGALQLDFETDCRSSDKDFQICVSYPTEKNQASIKLAAMLRGLTRVMAIKKINCNFTICDATKADNVAEMLARIRFEFIGLPDEEFKFTPVSVLSSCSAPPEELQAITAKAQLIFDKFEEKIAAMVKDFNEAVTRKEQG